MSYDLNVDPGLPRFPSTSAYWQTPPHELAEHQSTTLSNEADVLILGSGITGTSVAYHLLKLSPNLSVKLLEARTTTSGATGRNGGHIKDIPFSDYEELKTRFGKEQAMQIVKFRLSHVEALWEVAESLGPETARQAEVRPVEGACAVFDQKTWDDINFRREKWLEDFPGERSHYLSVAGSEAQKVSYHSTNLRTYEMILTRCSSEIWISRCDRCNNCSCGSALAL
jgi:hypothetical protein